MLGHVRGEMELSDIKDALADGCKVTLLVRHAERPPLDPTDKSFGASLPLTKCGWTAAREFGEVLSHTVSPQSVVFHASGTFRTLQTACAMAIGLDEPEAGRFIEKTVCLSEFLGSVSPFFGSADERWALIGEGRYHERMNDYFRSGQMRGYRPLKQATDEMELALDKLHGNDGLVVAVTHDINIAAFLAGRGVVQSFTEETWPGYLDAAVVVKRPDGHAEYGLLRWDKSLEGMDILPWAA